MGVCVCVCVVVGGGGGLQDKMLYIILGTMFGYILGILKCYRNSKYQFDRTRGLQHNDTRELLLLPFH